MAPGAHRDAAAAAVAAALKAREEEETREKGNDVGGSSTSETVSQSVLREVKDRWPLWCACVVLGFASWVVDRCNDVFEGHIWRTVAILCLVVGVTALLVLTRLTPHTSASAPLAPDMPALPDPHMPALADPFMLPALPATPTAPGAPQMVPTPPGKPLAAPTLPAASSIAAAASSRAPTATLPKVDEDADLASSSAPAFPSKAPFMVIKDDHALSGNEAAELAEKIMAILNRATKDATGVIADAKHKLSAISSAASFPIGEKVQMMKDVLLKLIAAWDPQNSGIDDLKSSFSELSRRIREMQMATDRLQGRFTVLERNAKTHEGRVSNNDASLTALEERLSPFLAYIERWKGDDFMQECGLAWARLLQEYTFEGDPRAEISVTMYMSDIIKEAAADPLHSARCGQVLAFAQRYFGLTQIDLEEVDVFLREDCRYSGRGNMPEKRALGVKELLQYASAAYDERWQVEQIIYLLHRFSPQGKPLDAQLSVFKQVIQQGSACHESGVSAAEPMLGRQ